MQIDNNKLPPIPQSSDDGIRRILAISTILLIVLDLIVYAITRDTGVLAGTTVVGIAVHAVFRYYFFLGNGRRNKGDT